MRLISPARAREVYRVEVDDGGIIDPIAPGDLRGETVAQQAAKESRRRAV